LFRIQRRIVSSLKGRPFVKRKELVTWHHSRSSGEPSPYIATTRHFGKDFWLEDAWYFADIYGEDGRNPEEPQHAVELNAEEVLRLVVMLDDQGRYHFDEMGCENLPEYLGYLVGAPFWTTCP
jgi:hypothetical protein